MYWLGILNGALLCVAILIVAAAVILELLPRDNKISEYVNKRLRRPIRSLKSLNSRLFISVHDVALIEKDIAGLCDVILVAARVQIPSASDFAPAVIDNFKEAVKYQFFVPTGSETERSLKNVHDAYAGLYQTARASAAAEGRHSRIKSHALEELFSINLMPVEWSENVPYLFYVFERPTSEREMVAFKGTDVGVGISREYVRLGASETKAIVELCAASSKLFSPAFGDRERLKVSQDIPQAGNVLSFGRD